MDEMTAEASKAKGRRAGTVAALAIAVALAGCGGSSSSTITHVARQTPAPSAADVGGAASARTKTASKGSPIGGRVAVKAPARAREASAAAPRSAAVPRQRAYGTPGTTKDEHRSSGAQPSNPCRLVSAAEAHSIVGGGALTAVDAPLGPTCVYRMGAGSDFTLAVETMTMSAATRTMTHRQQVTVAGRTGYCGRLGSQMLFLPVSAVRVLNVTAPCAVAERFAAIALTRHPA
jgi:hypothetical protein